MKKSQVKKSRQQYDIPYFIEKFEAIPRGQWCVGTFKDDYGRKCVLGWCGASWDDLGKGREYEPEEFTAICRIFADRECDVADVNDGTRKKYLKWG